MATRAGLALLFFLLAPPLARGQWNHDGKLLGNQVGSALHSSGALPDGAGGYIAVWHDGRVGRSLIIAQRVNASGYTLWTANGVLLSTLPTYNQNVGGAIPDGSGGAFVSYQYFEASGGDIYVQRVNAAGQVQWGANGVVACNATSGQNSPTLAPDGAGGVIVVWYDLRAGVGNSDVYAQRLNGSGSPQWTTNGVPVCTETGNQSLPEIISDGSGGAIVAWTDQRSAAAIYAQRLDASGARLWTPSNGVELSTPPNIQNLPKLVPDGAGGALVSWQDISASDVHVRRVNTFGTPLWGSGGVTLVPGMGSQSSPSIVSDGTGGAIVSWTDGRAGLPDVYAQRVDSLGTALWNANSVQLTNAAKSQTFPLLVSDGAAGAIAVWSDDRNESSGVYDLYGQRVNASGAVAWWDAGGNPVCKATGSQPNGPFAMTPDGAGGAFVVWPDTRVGTPQVYANRIMANGNVAALAADIASVTDEPQDEGGLVRIALTGAPADSGAGLPEVTGYNLWRRVDTSAMANGHPVASGDTRIAIEDLMLRSTRGPMRLDSQQSLAAGFPPGNWASQGFTAATQAPSYLINAVTPSDSTSAGSSDQLFVVAVHTTSPSLWVVGSPDSGHSVDNLAPTAPQNLGGAGSGPGTVLLTWDQNQESDLFGYAVHRGATADFVPSPGNRIGMPSDPSWTDPEFTAGSYYKVSARDRHDNESPFATLAPSQIVAVPGVEHPRVSYLGQAAPNPLSTETEIVYGLASSARVALRIYDTAGRIVRRLVDEPRAPGIHHVTWDARDGSGQPVAPGVYVARLTARGLDRTRKLVVTD